MQFTLREEREIVATIRAAERLTSGEIRVYIEPVCEMGDPLARAGEVFYANGMQETRHRNGVLLYLAPQSRQFAIFGDEGVAAKFPNDFWEKEKLILRDFLQRDEAALGVCEVILEIGHQLKKHFPAIKDDNPNELSDDIIYG